ncbi:hypothetical protein BASA81_000665 [Batrachochytrium salamandrivorans]|nr:hypothetical protein BASA81_000665 [Batrachochytrium salamandrivorans]
MAQRPDPNYRTTDVFVARMAFGTTQIMRAALLLPALLAIATFIVVEATTPLALDTDLTNTTLYAFGTDFAASLMQGMVFQYGMSVANNAEIIYTTVPLGGLECGYAGNTDDECKSMFHLFTNRGVKLDFDDHMSGIESGGRHLEEATIMAQLEIDFAISQEPVNADIPDLQNYPAFVYGVAPAFNLPGIAELTLDRLTLAKIFRGCDSTNVQCRPGSITQWNDSAIMATNPDIHSQLHAAGAIKVFVPQTAGPNTNAFKKAMSRFDNDFLLQIGNEAGDNRWNGTEFESVLGNYGVLRKVSQTPGSISFHTIHQIIGQLNVNTIHLVVSEGKVVYPETKSLYAAFSEVGMDFGNDGSDPALRHVDLTVAGGIQSWPIALVGYISTRKEHTPQNCRMRKLAFLSFMTFFRDVQAVTENTANRGTSTMTAAAGTILLELLRSDLKCDGELVYVPPPAAPVVVVYADVTLHSLLNTFLRDAATYGYDVWVQEPLTHKEFRTGWECMADRATCPYYTDLIVFADENLSDSLVEDAESSNKYKLFSLPYAAVATGFIHNFCTSSEADCDYRYTSQLVLDVITAANILDGKITWWNDTAIVALNPLKTLPNERIVVLPGPRDSSFHLDFIQTIRTSYLPDFAYRAGDSLSRSMYLEAWIDVALTPFSFSYVVMNSTVIEGVEKVSLRNDQGVDVAVSPASIEACAMDTYDETIGLFHLSRSTEPDCYPLSVATNIFIVNPVVYDAAAYLLKTLNDQSVREGAGRTAVYISGFGTLSDLKLPDGLDLAKKYYDLLETITYVDTGKSVLRIPHELNLIPEGAIQAMYVVMCIEIFCFLGLMVWTVAHRNRKLVRNSSPLFMLQVLFGAIVMALTVIPLSFQDDHLLPRAMTLEELKQSNYALNIACVADPIFFSVGFFITFSAIFLKAWRLIKIFNNNKLKNLFLRDRQLMLYQAAVVVVVIVLNALWAGIDPMVWERVSWYENSEGLVVGSAGICVSRGGVASAAPLLVGIILILVVGNYLAYLGRFIPTEFNESKWTGMAMMMILEAFVIAVPVLILSNDQPVPGFIVKSLVCLLVSGGTVGLIFIPKIMLAYGWGEAKDDTNPWRFVRGSDSSNNTKDSKKVAQQQQAMLSQIVGTTAQPLSSPSLQHAAAAPRQVSSFMSAQNFPSASKTTSEALARILQDDPSRRKFRRFLKTLKMEENVRFWDATMITKAETNENKRYAGTRAVIQSFVCDSSPFQVNLSSATKQAIVSAFETDDKQRLKDPAFFDQAMAEMFDDLKQSDAFRAFMEQDTFSTANLA